MEQEKSLQKVDKWSRGKRIEDLKKEGETIGLWNVDKTKKAKEYGVSRQQVYQDIKNIYKHGIDKNSLDQAIVNISNLNKKLLNGLQQEFNRCQIPSDKAKIAHALLATEEKITDFLERYGFKEKAPERLQVQGESIQLVINGTGENYPNIPASKQETKPVHEQPEEIPHA